MHTGKRDLELLSKKLFSVLIAHFHSNAVNLIFLFVICFRSEKFSFFSFTYQGTFFCITFLSGLAYLVR